MIRQRTAGFRDTRFAIHRLAGLIGVAVLAMLVVASSAAADYLSRGVVADTSTIQSPRRVAVEQSTGNGFVVEEARDRVLVFAPDGLGAVPLTELGVGILDNPFGIAIEESGGQTAIYVSDAGNNRIVRFLSDEQPTPTFTLDAAYTSPAQGAGAGEIQSFASPLALAPDGDLWVADTGADVIKRFDPTGAHVAGSDVDGSTSPEGAFTGLLDLAVNSEGDLYVIDSTGDPGKGEGTSRVQRFAETGAYKATLGPLGERNRSAIVAVNPADDRVLVSGDQDGIQHGDFTPRFHLFDSSDTHLEEVVGDGTFFQGGSYRGAAFFPDMRNRFYLAVGRNWYPNSETGELLETAGVPGVHVYSEAIAPSVLIDPVGDAGGDSATITGEVNPNGLPSKWQVEFKRAAATEWEGSGPRSAGEGTDPVPVSEELQGLLPGQEYEARLQAQSVDGSSQSSIVSFTTDVVAPRVVRQSADPGVDGATLHARINPGGAETTYHFEYGPTASYGESTAPATIPAGGGAVNVSAAIDGLTPGTTYHFRVVAENAEGSDAGEDATFTTLADETDSCPNARFRTGPDARLSDCRAYELVTPLEAEADVRMGGGQSTPDGSVACYASEFPIAGSDPNGVKLPEDGFCAWRGEGGWETKWMTGPAPEKRFASMGGSVYFLSEDGARAVFASDQFILGPDYISPGSAAGTQMRSYMWEGGLTRQLSPAPTPIVIPGFGEFFFPENNDLHKRPLAASKDATRSIFQSDNRLIPEDTNFVPDLYEWSPGGLRIVSAVEGSSEAAGGTAPFFRVEQLSAQGTMSADGSRVFFHHEGAPLDPDADPAAAPETLQSVYMREGDEVTLVSPRDAGNADRAFRFAGASADGETVYVESIQEVSLPGGPHTVKGGEDVYVYDVSSGELELFASAAGGAEVLGISEDGSTVVYRSLGSFRVFVARGGETTLLGTLAPTERSMRQQGDTPYRLGSQRPDQRALRITPDGSALVFAAAGDFDGTTGGVTQIYRWSEEDGVQRISAGESQPTQNASIGAYGGYLGGDPREEFLANHRYKTFEGRVISEDGSRVFFETPEALVERDVNEVVDLYEWHDGRVDLISGGTGSKALYHDSSADGKTVFFTTYERLEPGFDRNNNRDLYVAQPNGGFPPPPPAPDCEGEACQPQRPAPPAGDPASGAAGEGNLSPAPKIEIAAFGRKQAKQLAARGRATVRIAVAEPGRVTAVLRGKVNGRSAIVAKASRSVSKAGVISLQLKLSKNAREHLRKRGKLRLTLEVRQSSSDQTARKAVVLRG